MGRADFRESGRGTKHGSSSCQTVRNNSLPLSRVALLRIAGHFRVRDSGDIQRRRHHRPNPWREHSGMKRPILIVGYPKSGNTWITRLIAELLGAPVVGFWNELHRPEIAVEGLDRTSDFEVYKGHQALAEIRDAFSRRNIVYVARDVRDIAVSGAHYFPFRPKSPAKRVLQRLRWRNRRRYDSCANLETMLHALSLGDASVSHWCAGPWDDHVREYLDAGTFFVRFEDVLATPQVACQRILQHLGVERSQSHIEAAISAQSFANTKRRFIDRNDWERAAFLRAGRSGEWLTSLTEQQRAFCDMRFSSTMRRLGYPPSALPAYGVQTSLFRQHRTTETGARATPQCPQPSGHERRPIGHAETTIAELDNPSSNSPRGASGSETSIGYSTAGT